MMNHFLTGQSRRYKGNLHLHTTNSDGKRTLAESVAWYHHHGYDFVAITDHYAVTDSRDVSVDGFLVIPGVELSVDTNELGEPYHLVALSPQVPLPSVAWRELPIQVAIDMLNQAGAMVILAHPYWSGLTLAEMLPLQGISALEVYNTSANRDLGKALSVVHWDDVLVRGKGWWGVAVDDTHWVDNDAGEAWVMVEADNLNEESIISALKGGHFYASTGPDIYELSLDGENLFVRCSPVTTINIIGHTQWGGQRRAEPGTVLTEATYRVRGNETYLRVECIDAHGRSAWSNPIYLGALSSSGGS